MAIETVVTHLPLERAAQAFADAVANPPFITDLGPEKGRETLDEVQAVNPIGNRCLRPGAWPARTASWLTRWSSAPRRL